LLYISLFSFFPPPFSFFLVLVLLCFICPFISSLSSLIFFVSLYPYSLTSFLSVFLLSQYSFLCVFKFLSFHFIKFLPVFSVLFIHTLITSSILLFCYLCSFIYVFLFPFFPSCFSSYFLPFVLLVCLFLRSLFNVPANSSHYRALNFRTINEQLIAKNQKGSGRSISWCNILTFVWKDWARPQKCSHCNRCACSGLKRTPSECVSEAFPLRPIC
jgi:hypothetical protein